MENQRLSWKKRVSILLGILAAFVVLAYLFRYTLGSLIIEMAIGDFDPAKAPPAPDYAQESSWAALPDKEDASDRVPDGLVETSSSTRDLVDVFYVHPTGYMGRENWNATVGKESTYGIPTSVMLAGQASAFNGCGRIYAPEYRQASIFAFIQPHVAPQRMDAFQALDLAYSDVARAFDYFVEHYNKGKPFFIVSHSQGSTHVLRLLAEKIDNTPLRSRLIAAYVIGYTMPKDYFSRVYHNLKPCESPTQSGCIIAWDTVREGAWAPSLSIHRYPQGWEYPQGKEIFCVNPLTWNSTPDRAPATANAGALAASIVPSSVRSDRCEFKGLIPHQTWAQCHEGRLWVADQSNTAFHDTLGIYHLFDFGLFWMNIRENARVRSETYIRAGRDIAQHLVDSDYSIRTDVIVCLGA